MSDVILGVTLKSTTGKLTTADQVFDKVSNKTQEQINQEIKTAVSGIYNFRGSVDTLFRIKEKVPLKVGDVFNLTAGFMLEGKRYTTGTNVAVIKAVNNQSELANEYVYHQYFDPLGGTITGLVTSTELTNKGYQTAGQVNTLINNATNGKLVNDTVRKKIALLNDKSVVGGALLNFDIITECGEGGADLTNDKKYIDYFTELYNIANSSEHSQTANFIRTGNTVSLVHAYNAVHGNGQNTDDSVDISFIYNGKYYEYNLIVESGDGHLSVSALINGGIPLSEIKNHRDKITALENNSTWYTLG